MIKADFHVIADITRYMTDHVHLFARITQLKTPRMFAKLAMQHARLVATQGFKTVLHARATMLWMKLIHANSVMLLALHAATPDSKTVLHVSLVTWSIQEHVNPNVPVATLPILRTYARLAMILVPFVSTLGHKTAFNA